MNKLDYLIDNNETDNDNNIDDYNNVDENDFDDNTIELNFIRIAIESMSKFNQIEVLRILKKYKDVTLWENNYGVHINLSEIKKETIYDLKEFINYVNKQECTLHDLEEQKEKFKNTYFTKDNKDIKINNSKVNGLSS